MVIERLPAVVDFESGDPGRAAVLRIGEEGGNSIYMFTVLTPELIRMGNEDDNSVSLFLDGKWERFTASGLSSRSDASVSVTILENNNKRSRYRVRIEIPGPVPADLQAKAEGLIIG